jgi:hypothetical protein
MSFRPSFTKLLGPSALLLLLGVTGAGCGGCGDSNAAVHCNESGTDCVVCDGYGCHPADPQLGSGGAGAAGNSSSSTGGAVDNCDSSKTTCSCDTAKDCPSGTTCLEGLCLVGCEYSYQCGDGKICANGQCLAGCDAKLPCEAGYACDKGVCVADPQNPACTEQAPCAQGEICVDGLCTTGCKTHDDCAVGELCDEGSESCIKDPSPEPGCDAAKTCPAAAKCGADGYCHYPCSSLQQCKLVDNRFEACAQGTCKTQEEINPECSLNKPCSGGKDCISNKCL